MIRSISIAFAAFALTACVSVLPEPEAPEGLYRFGAMTQTYPVEAVVASRLMQVAMLDALDDSGAGVGVALGTGARADYELVWRIEDFTLAGTRARCGLEATLVQANTRKVVAQKTVTSTADAAASSNASRALALAEAGRACVGQVASFVSEKAVAPEPETEPDA